ncbi:MAG: tRNA adenosine(34) deaminase TadA [Deltaproteobacteria bacterium]|nr:tRNA adenosine(34) deaminase TadA [Deltaproteobacteria bacterium]
MQMNNNKKWMIEALALARAAAVNGEVPVGALVVCDNVVVGSGNNRREIDNDPLAHAEIFALRQAAANLGRWRLFGCTLYVTLEPCPMCAGAVVNARVDRVVFGAADPRAGAAGSIYNIIADPRLNHRAEIVAGVMAEESALLLREFFFARRSKVLNEEHD